MKRARAVTLVELVVTMAIALILAGAAIGGIVGVKTWRATAAVRRVQADLTYARARAMLTGRRTLCSFDAAKQEYVLRQEPQPATGRISGPPMIHPQDHRPWRVRLADLGSVRVKLPGTLNSGGLGFATDGRPVTRLGKPLAKDVRLTFSNGARLIVRAGSGLCETVWP